MTDKPKFTPGPFKVYEPLDTFGYNIIRPAGDAEMGDWLMACRVRRIEDAHLIAAAPALYEALTKILGWRERDYRDMGEIVKFIESTASAALRAARGEP